jgi:hypothetical protein
MTRLSDRATRGIRGGLKKRWLKRGRYVVFIDVESSGGPVYVPCLIGRPLNPGGPTLCLRL